LDDFVSLFVFESWAAQSCDLSAKEAVIAIDQSHPPSERTQRSFQRAPSRFLTEVKDSSTSLDLTYESLVILADVFATFVESRAPIKPWLILLELPELLRFELTLNSELFLWVLNPAQPKVVAMADPRAINKTRFEPKDSLDPLNGIGQFKCKVVGDGCSVEDLLHVHRVDITRSWQP
jgi:hypothetical protein